MKRSNQPDDSTVWRVATWDGATREAMRRWAELPLVRMLAAQEEMQDLADELGQQCWRSNKPDT